METLFQHLESPAEESFITFHFEKKHYDVPLHYHPEIEIMYVIKGHGLRIVGDSIRSFKEGDLVIVGSGISHVWKSDRIYQENNDLRTEYIVLFVKKEMLTNHFFKLPEFSKLSNMLANANRGMKFPEKDALKLGQQFYDIIESNGIDKFNKMITLLSELSDITTFEYLSTKAFNEGTENYDSDRLNKCIDYITDNYQKSIKLKEVAEMANLTPNSFCRYFKVRTTKTLSQYITELRINKACQLLIKSNSNIDDIAFESGFNALPNFYNHFYNRMEMRPTEYREKYK